MALIECVRHEVVYIDAVKTRPKIVIFGSYHRVLERNGKC